MWQTEMGEQGEKMGEPGKEREIEGARGRGLGKRFEGERERER